MSFPNSNKSSTMASPLESTPSAEQRVIVLDSQVTLGGSSLPPTSSVSSSSSSSTKHNGEKDFVFGFYKVGSDAPPVIVADKSFNAEFSRTGYSYSVRGLKQKLKYETKRETPISCTDNGYVIFTSWEI